MFCIVLYIGLFVYTSGCIIIIEDLHDGKQWHFLGHVEEISTLTLQHDIQYLASASGSSDMVASQICIWEIQTGSCKKVKTSAMFCDYRIKQIPKIVILNLWFK